MNFEAVIGLEIHVQLNTRTKTFCGCSTEFDEQSNIHTCPVCLGLPGALPVLNAEAVKKAVTAGIALNCEIASFSVFARKNYFYPDLPKAYQISQYEKPINVNGHITITTESGQTRKIRITRAHLEEDAGKLVHDEDPKGPSYVDFNRCGVPLLEIVTEPDIRTPEEACLLLEAVKEIMQYSGVSDCSMEKGELRVDVNISLRESGAGALGVKQEIKNMNSFANVKRALEFEIKRQSKVLRGGGIVKQETRLFDPNKNATVSMRSKEEAHDYRYFPDPDLVPVILEKDFIDSIRSSLPELPESKRRRFVRDYGLTEYDAANICSSPFLANYFEEAAGEYGKPKKLANWILSETIRVLNERKIRIDRFTVTPHMLVELFELMDRGVISGKIAKEVFNDMAASGKRAEAIVDAKGLKQVTNRDEIARIVEAVISENTKVVEDYRGGKKKAFGFLVGLVMKKTGGKANPGIVNEILKHALE